MILDRTDDKDRYLQKLYEGEEIPTLIKTAADSTVAHRKHAEDYALVRPTKWGNEYKYPICDSGNALVSALYFKEYGHQLPSEQQKTAAACITDALRSFGFDVPDELEKTAAMELGYSDKADDLTLARLFFSEGDDFDVLEDAFNSCSPRGKRRLMMQVKTASATEEMQDYANPDWGSDIQLSVDERCYLLHEESAKDDYQVFLQKCAHISAESAVDQLEILDKKYELDRYYGRYIEDPVLSVYGTRVKRASVPHIEVGGISIPTSSFSEMVASKIDDIEDHFGESFAKQMSDNPADVYNSLPTPNKAAFDLLLTK